MHRLIDRGLLFDIIEYLGTIIMNYFMNELISFVFVLEPINPCTID